MERNRHISKQKVPVLPLDDNLQSRLVGFEPTYGNWSIVLEKMAVSVYVDVFILMRQDTSGPLGEDRTPDIRINGAGNKICTYLRYSNSGKCDALPTELQEVILSTSFLAEKRNHIAEREEP